MESEPQVCKILSLYPHTRDLWAGCQFISVKDHFIFESVVFHGIFVVPHMYKLSTLYL